MDCKQLFAIFEKIGGEFVCNYKDNTGKLLPPNIECCGNTVKLLPPNIECKNLNHAKYDLDSFTLELSMYPSLFTETKLLQDEKVEKIHHYQDMSLKELSIKFCRDEEGYASPCEKDYRLLGKLNRKKNDYNIK